MQCNTTEMVRDMDSKTNTPVSPKTAKPVAPKAPAKAAPVAAKVEAAKPEPVAAKNLLQISEGSDFRAIVIGVGGSLGIAKPYLVAVISKNCISRRMLFSAEISKSIVLYMG